MSSLHLLATAHDAHVIILSHSVFEYSITDSHKVNLDFSGTVKNFKVISFYIQNQQCSGSHFSMTQQRLFSNYSYPSRLK